MHESLHTFLGRAAEFTGLFQYSSEREGIDTEQPSIGGWNVIASDVAYLAEAIPLAKLSKAWQCLRQGIQGRNFAVTLDPRVG